jgi:isopentenyl-diphosphate delta-isomerase
MSDQQHPIVESAPGKLYLAGEYAILTPGNPALLMAVNRGVTAQLTLHSGRSGHLTSSLYPGKSVTWERGDDGQLHASGDVTDFSFAWKAIEVADRYARQLGCTPQMFSVALSSTLDASDGRKFGLGSSAAVVVACVKAILHVYGLEADSLTVYKIAACAHWLVQGNGSLGDVAASSVGGFLVYQSVDRAWLSDVLTKLQLTRVVAAQWPCLRLRSVRVNPNIRVMVGWTGKPASTEKLVARQQSHSGASFDEHAFTHESAAAVCHAVRALENGDFAGVAVAVEKNRDLLHRLAQAKSLPIEIPVMTKAIQASQRLGAVAKSSGAGGGDCLIAFYRADNGVDCSSQLRAAWKNIGIIPIDLTVSTANHVADVQVQTASTESTHITPCHMNARQKRKEEHLRLAQQLYSSSRHTDFDAVHLVRPTLPEMRVEDVTLATDFFGTRVALPIMINAMTGGTAHSTQINIRLARAAAACHIPIAFGSASIVAQDPDALDGFLTARRAAGKTPVVINVNPSTPSSTLMLLIERCHPAAVQIHVNAVQEIVMPEGDRDFRWIDDIRRLKQCAEKYGCPVIVKEVGFGFDRASIHRLCALGVQYIDCAGAGGTNFAAIENVRNHQEDWSWLTDCGLSTVQSLLNARLESSSSKLTVIASGGIRNPLDMLKSFALGASFIGVSGVILHQLLSADTLDEGQRSVEKLIQTWGKQLARLCAVYSVAEPSRRTHIPVWLSGDVKEYWDAARADFPLTAD